MSPLCSVGTYVRAAVAASALLLAGAAAAVADTSPAEIEVSVTVPDGGALSVAVSEDALDLAEAVLAEDRSAWVASGALPTITVEDTRVTDPGWNLSAQVSPFLRESPEGTDASGQSLLDAVVSVVPTAGSQSAPGLELVDSVDLGNAVADGDTVADHVLAWTGAGKGFGSTEIGGDVEFRAPLEADAGDYSAVITLTVS
jgi:hypothetical protein